MFHGSSLLSYLIQQCTRTRSLLFLMQSPSSLACLKSILLLWFSVDQLMVRSTFWRLNHCFCPFSFPSLCVLVWSVCMSGLSSPCRRCADRLIVGGTILLSLLKWYLIGTLPAVDQLNGNNMVQTWRKMKYYYIWH